MSHRDWEQHGSDRSRRVSSSPHYDRHSSTRTWDSRHDYHRSRSPFLAEHSLHHGHRDREHGSGSRSRRVSSSPQYDRHSSTRTRDSRHGYYRSRSPSLAEDSLHHGHRDREHGSGSRSRRVSSSPQYDRQSSTRTWDSRHDYYRSSRSPFLAEDSLHHGHRDREHGSGSRSRRVSSSPQYDRQSSTRTWDSRHDYYRSSRSPFLAEDSLGHRDREHGSGSRSRRVSLSPHSDRNSSTMTWDRHDATRSPAPPSAKDGLEEVAAISTATNTGAPPVSKERAKTPDMAASLREATSWLNGLKAEDKKAKLDTSDDTKEILTTIPGTKQKESFDCNLKTLDFNNGSRKSNFQDFQATILKTRTRKASSEKSKLGTIGADLPILIDDSNDDDDSDFKPKAKKAAAGTRTRKGRPPGAPNKVSSKGAVKSELVKAQMELESMKRKANVLCGSPPSTVSGTTSVTLPLKPQAKKSTLQLEEIKFNMQDHAIEGRFIEQIYNGCLMNKLGTSWNDIGGLLELKDSMKEMVIHPLLRPDIFKGLRAAPKGVLLYGPPGTGKTMIAQCLASECACNFFNVSASSLTSKWVGDGEKTVQALFAVARAMQPAVIFIDEADSILSKRGDKEGESAKKMKTEFLVQMDGAATGVEEKLLVVAASNRPADLDEAVRRRLTKRFYVPLPDTEGRYQIFSSILQKVNTSLTEEELRAIALRAEGYSGADINKICKEAAMGPIRECPNILELSADEIRPIEAKDLEMALTKIKPSVSPKDLAHYREFDRSFGDKP